MKIVILGAGVIGVTNAYFLAERGHEVIVVDRGSGAGLETSFANGGQLSYCHPEPWANPAAIPKIIKWLGKKDAPLVFRPNLDPSMWAWGLKFLANCTGKKAYYNMVNTLRLALYSRESLKQILGKNSIDFNFSENGILHIFKDDKSFKGALEQARIQKEFGATYQSLSYQECVKLEPALINSKERIIGGIHFPLDGSGDIYTFTKALAEICQAKFGVVFKYNHQIQDIENSGGEISGIKTDQGVITGDKYIMALGSYSPVYLNKLGIRTSIYPMKGYSISIPIMDAKKAPQISITDQSQKLVYSRLGNILRVAGTAEFAKYDTSVSEFRTESIKKHAAELFPEGLGYGKITKWACLRPSTPQGSPLLGKTRIKNLFLNTGHGTLGWTLAAGSSKIVSDIVEEKIPEIDLKGLTLV